jgi:hypothetical protein
MAQINDADYSNTEYDSAENQDANTLAWLLLGLL